MCSTSWPLADWLLTHQIQEGLAWRARTTGKADTTTVTAVLAKAALRYAIPTIWQLGITSLSGGALSNECSGLRYTS